MTMAIRSRNFAPKLAWRRYFLPSAEPSPNAGFMATDCLGFKKCKHCKLSAGSMRLSFTQIPRVIFDNFPLNSWETLQSNVQYSSRFMVWDAARLLLTELIPQGSTRAVGKWISPFHVMPQVILNSHWMTFPSRPRHLWLPFHLTSHIWNLFLRQTNGDFGQCARSPSWHQPDTFNRWTNY